MTPLDPFFMVTQNVAGFVFAPKGITDLSMNDSIGEKIK